MAIFTLLPRKAALDKLKEDEDMKHMQLSNMIGPTKEPWTFLGAKLEEIIATNPSHGPMAMTLVSTNDTFRLTFLFDQSAQPENPEKFVNIVQ